MVRWVVGSIFHSGPIKLFLVIGNVPRLVFGCLLGGAYKRHLAAKRKE